MFLAGNVAMVTCTKCGAENSAEARFCVNCGASIYAERKIVKREDTCFGERERHVEEGCFGLPQGGAIAGIIIGCFIVLLGLSILFGFDIGRWIGPAFLIIVGILIIIGILYQQSKRRR